MARSPQAAYEAHARALGAGDLEQLAADYSENCIQMVNGHTRRGRPGAKEGFTHIFSELGTVNAMETPVLVFEDNVVYLEWWADLGDRRCEGVDTFVVEDGLFTIHTIQYRIQAAGPAST